MSKITTVTLENYLKREYLYCLATIEMMNNSIGEIGIVEIALLIHVETIKMSLLKDYAEAQGIDLNNMGFDDVLGILNMDIQDVLISLQLCIKASDAPDTLSVLLANASRMELTYNDISKLRDKDKK